MKQVSLFRRQQGQSATEMLIVLPLLLLLGLGMLQLSLLYQAKGMVGYAAMAAARAGAVNYGSTASMRDAFAGGLMPLFNRATTLAATNAAMNTALTEADDPTLTEIVTLNPTAAAMSDFARSSYYPGQMAMQIPNDTLFYRDPTPGPSSGMSIQDANLLKIQVRYCYAMYVPMVDSIIGSVFELLQSINSNGTAACPQDASGTGTFRIPVFAQAVARMQSPYRGADYVVATASPASPQASSAPQPASQPAP